MNFQAPTAFATFYTRGGTFTSDANGLISGATGIALQDLLASGCVPVTVSPVANFRNILDGGDFTVNPWQRNIPGLASAGVISSAISNTVTYFADRFFAVGGASSSILMAQVADTTVPGFSQSLLYTRSSGNSNTAALSFGQVVESLDTIKLQGQTVTLSFWARTAANYSGGALSVTLACGTGSNQSAANLVAGSWTNQANVISATQVLNGSMTRYSFTGVVPVNATQVGLLISWTPTGTAGTTDGIYYNGLQLEAGGLSVFEHRDVQVELEICQRYAWVIAEPAAGVVIGTGSVVTTNNEVWYLATPVQMRAAPTITTSAGTFKTNSTGTPTAATGLTGNATHTVNAIGLAATGTGTAGMGTLLQGGGGSGYIVANSDF